MKIKCGKCGVVDEAIEKSAYARYQCKHCDTINEITNIELKEWLGFSYSTFLQSIEKFIEADDFKALKASNDLELQAGRLDESDINKLKQILIVSFKEGLSIRDIRNKITREINIKDLHEIKDNKITDKILAYSERRPIMIARTEATRAAAEGSLLNYKDNDIQEVSFLSSFSERTCDLCSSLNGKIMTLAEAHELIPYGTHPYCRCTWIPIVKNK